MQKDWLRGETARSRAHTQPPRATAGDGQQERMALGLRHAQALGHRMTAPEPYARKQAVQSVCTRCGMLLYCYEDAAQGSALTRQCARRLSVVR